MYSHFGETLQRLATQRGFSRSTLRRRLGIDAPALAEIEQSAAPPAHAHVVAIATALAMDPEELLLAAGILPGWIESALTNHPSGAIQALRPLVEPRACGSEDPPISPPPVVLGTPLGTLHHGDCLPLLASLETGTVDLVFADPPFNLNKDYGARVDDNLLESAYFRWSCAWLSEAVRVLKPGGSLFLYNLPRWNIHLGSWLSTRLEFRHWISVDIKFSLPIAGRLYPSHYSLLYFSKGRRPKRFSPPRLPIETCRHCGGEIPDYGGYKDRMNPKGVNLTDVWTDIAPVRHARFKRRRANELPLKLLDRVLDIASAEGDVVLDPFGGSGTTYVAAELKRRRWLGCEIEDCSPIMERFKRLDRESDILDSIRESINVLFTPKALSLRRRNGHDTSRYRLDDSPPALRVSEGDLFGE